MRRRILIPLASLFAVAAWVAYAEDPAADPPTPALEGLPSTPTFELSPGAESQDAPARAELGKATPLEPALRDALLGRLPALDPAQEREFAVRKGPPPPERTGETVEQPFPPGPRDPAQVTAPEGPLQVLRYQPEGEQPLVPRLSVTFSEPMVAVGSLEDLAREAIPVRLDPEPAGQWRWVGTETLLFEPEGERFPMSGRYTVTVPAGTRAASGNTLPEAQSWSFSTPTLAVERGTPTRVSELQPTVGLRFNQRVDPRSLLPALAVYAGDREVAIRPATKDERDALGATYGDDRCVAFRPVEPLPGASTIRVEVRAGARSAEGPVPTPATLTHAFQTFGPLQVVKVEAGRRGKCPPGYPVRVEFTNPLDAEVVDPSLVTSEPEIPGLQLGCYNDTLVIQGLTRALTSYRVTLAAGVADRFGQTLGEPYTFTFKTSAPEPRLGYDHNELVTLDPGGKPRYDVRSIGIERLRVRIAKVDPTRDWEASRRWRQQQYRRDRDGSGMPGELVVDTTVDVSEPLSWSTTSLDLAPALEDGLGHVLVWVEPVPQPERGWRAMVTPWIQSTELALDVISERDRALAWVTKLADGAPVAGARVQLGSGEATSDPQGLATVSLPGARTEVALASLGQDRVLVPGYWQQHDAAIQPRWFTFDDRHLYRPQETVHVKGWVRPYDPNRGGDVLAFAGSLPNASYTLQDRRGRELSTGTLELDAYGGFDLELALPDDVNLGWANLTLQPGNHRHTFQIAEFRRPEFEVGVTPSGGAPYLLGDPLSFTGKASYFAGGALPGAELGWQVTVSEGHYAPPNCRGFSFGRYVPWWWGGYHGGSRRGSSLQGTTDGSGKHTVDVALRELAGVGPAFVEAQATVHDVNRQAWSGSAKVLVHPAALYVGLKPERPYVPAGKPLALETLTVDLDGNRVAQRPVKLTFERSEWRRHKGTFREEVVEQHVIEQRSGADPQRAALEAPTGGRWRVVAEVQDAQGRTNRSVLELWVAGGEPAASEQANEEGITLIPDRERYEPGQTAKLLAVVPFSASRVLITTQRSGILTQEVRELAGSTTEIEVALDDALVPDVTVSVQAVGATPRADDPKGRARPAFAGGTLTLPIAPQTRTLGVRVTPAAAQLAPGSETSIQVEVEDPDGRPLPEAQVVLCVVDEAVLFLSGYRHPDPLSVFYSQRGPGVGVQRSRSWLRLQRLADDDQSNAEGGEESREFEADSAMAESAPGAPMMAKRGAAGFGGGGAAQAPIAVRKDLRALAVFSPSVITDAEGKASVSFTLPDSLTRYRVVAMAADRIHAFGSAESAVTARLPLMVRPSAPRFLNFGDRCELPVVVQNQTAADMEVQVALRASNLQVETGGFTLRVPAHDRREVRFPVAALEAGEAKLQVVASCGEASDAQDLSFPVWTPATSEAFATYGVLDLGARLQPIQPPSDVWPQFGGLEVQTSSTALQSLTDAVIYLADYPYGCAEQIGSRVLALTALQDVLGAFQAEELPSAEALKQGVERDLNRLAQIQGSSGGWGFWSAGDRDWPYLTIHVTHALAQAQAKGYPVEAGMLRRASGYLSRIESHIPAWYSVESARALKAYALDVRRKLGDAQPLMARSLFAEAGEDLPLEALGWIYPLLVGTPDQAAALRIFHDRLQETAGAAHFVTRYADGEHVLLHSDRRADGVILEALMSDPTQARGDLTAKLVQGLLAHRTRGRWTNTQENAFVLLALDRYFRVAEAIEPDFVARVWLGDAFAGEHAFRGRTVERAQIEVPMDWLQEAGPSELALAKDGPGRLYYRIGLRYAPRDLDLKPLNAGFTVERSYEAVDDPADVTRGEDGTWSFKAGARVRVRLTLVAPTRRYHVALVDPLPAGLEAIDPGLPAMGSLPEDPTSSSRRGCWWWTRTWYEHSALRDERAEAFTSLLWAGVHTYTYVARATTPGEFVVPPTKAEEMYAPETFGRGATDRVVVR